jgi:predicted nuclease of predicted toxin-antitoxin system
MQNKKVAVVDGANVAHVETTGKGDPKVANLLAVRQVLTEKGYHPIIIVDAALHHRIDDAEQLEALINKQQVRQAPAGTDADYFVIKIAEEENAVIISNDQYKDYQEQFPWVSERRIPLMIVHGNVELYEPAVEGA